MASQSYFAEDFVRGIFSIAVEKPLLYEHQGESHKSQVKERALSQKLSLLVWNIHKGEMVKVNKKPLPFSLSAYDLIALQEDAWPWSLKNLKYPGLRYFVPTFQLEGQKTGTSLYSKYRPHKVEVFHTQYAEPFIITPKSFLIAHFKEFDLLNVHSLNFVSFEEWHHELKRVFKKISKDRPTMLLGDFNTWDEERTKTLKGLAKERGLQEIVFKKDLRSQVLGRPVDFVFARGFILRDANVFNFPDYSDHNPMEVVLQLKENKGSN